MKKASLIILILLFVLYHPGDAQTSQFPPDSKPASTNVQNAQYPRIDTQSRVTFRINAPDAQKVQIDLTKKFHSMAHERLTWRRPLHEFAQLLFNN